MPRREFCSRHSGFERLAALPALNPPSGVEGPAVGAAVVHTSGEKLRDEGAGAQDGDDDEESQGGLCHERFSGMSFEGFPVPAGQPFLSDLRRENRFPFAQNSLRLAP